MLKFIYRDDDGDVDPSKIPSVSMFATLQSMITNAAANARCSDGNAAYATLTLVVYHIAHHQSCWKCSDPCCPEYFQAIESQMTDAWKNARCKQQP